MIPLDMQDLVDELRWPQPSPATCKRAADAIERLSAHTIPEGDVLDAIKDGLAGWIGISDLDEAATSVRDALQPHILSAVEAERERCAKVADDCASVCGAQIDSAPDWAKARDACLDIAAAIRTDGIKG